MALVLLVKSANGERLTLTEMDRSSCAVDTQVDTTMAWSK